MAAAYRLQNIWWAIGTVIFIIVTSVALGHAARSVAKWRGLSQAEQRKVYWGFMFAGPWIVGFFIFVVGPALASLYYSFTDYKLGEPMDWVGLANYRQFLLGEGAHGRRFTQAMFNSFYYALVGVPLQIVAALGMAMLLNKEMPGIRIFRMIFYLPVILAGGPAILLAWRYMLATNGGFINITLQNFAHSFVLFDYVYRAFIYVVESFNGFYIGLTRGDPIGPLKYTLPAILAVLFIAPAASGDWSHNKKIAARRGAEIIGLIAFFYLASKGLVLDPIDPAWILFGGLIVTLGILVSAHNGRYVAVRTWQYASLSAFGLSLLLTAARPDAAELAGQLIALGAVVALVAGSFLGGWSRTKMVAFGAVAVLLAIGLFVHLIPGQLDGGRLGIIPAYLSFGSTIEHPDDLEYLKEIYPQDTMSAMWFYGLAAAVLFGAVLLDGKHPRARKYLLYGGLIFFALIALSSLLDGIAYFRAFEEIAAAEGKPVYHFSMFRNAIEEFPDSDRLPMWMGSELWSKPALVLITMWSSGSGMLIFLAALKGVPRELYEAAEVDGANAVQKFFKITLPMISPAMFYNVVIGIIAALQTFDTIYILQNTQTESSLRSAAYFLFTRTFRELAIGQGAAVSWILVIITVTLTVFQFRYSSWVYYEA